MKTLILLRVLADGKPRTSREIGIELGMTPKQVEGALKSLREHGRISKRPPVATTYEITPKGAQVAARTPEDEARRGKHAAREARRRERLKAEREARMAPIVERAMRHPLQMAWRAAA